MNEQKPIHKMGTTANGSEVSAGYYVVGPNGQLVLSRPDQPVKPGWRLATEDDIAQKELLEEERRAKDTSGEHEARERQAAFERERQAAIEASSTKWTVDDPGKPGSNR
jgi:hypothetical protein